MITRPPFGSNVGTGERHTVLFRKHGGNYFDCLERETYRTVSQTW
jgi:hypothetical protein